MTMTDDPAMVLAQAALESHRHNTRLIVALRETQLEHGERLNAIDAKLGEHDRRFDAIDARLDEHDRRFDAIDARLDEHDRRFDAIDARLDEHDRRFDAIDRRFEAVDEELSSIRNTVGRIAVGMYTLEKLIRRIVPDDGEDATN